jgi:hypothetical protein
VTLRRIALRVFLHVLCLLVLVPSSLGQGESATLSGRITDLQGRVVPGVAVDVTNVDTNIIVHQTTNSVGVYVVVGLKPGRYRVAVTKEGFRRIDLMDLVLNVQDVLSRNFQLQLGSVLSSVTVTANAANANTMDAAVSTVIDRQFVEDLPLNGRSFNVLLQLTPGVVIGVSNVFEPGQFNIAGQRTDANNFEVDGVSANFGNNWGLGAGQSGTGSAPALSAIGGTSSLVSVEDLQEFRVVTSSSAPEFGRAPGGQVLLTTRSGTNRFHGGVYEYFRNDVMDANDWFADQNGLPKPEERHNDFGGYVGGPIWKDKTFFFFSYEGARLRLPQTTTISVPSMAARTTISPELAPYLDAYPKANDATAPVNYVARFTGTYSNASSLDATSIRIDQSLGNRFSIFGRYDNAPSNITNRINSLSQNLQTFVNTSTLTVGVDMKFTHQSSNALRANYSAQSSEAHSWLDNFYGAVPVDPALLLGSLTVSGNTAGFAPDFLINEYAFGNNGLVRTRQINLVDTLSLLRGSHLLKFGADYRGIFLDVTPYEHSVSFLSSSLQDFVTSGATDIYTSSAYPSKLLSDAFSLYAQDTWKASPKLTITYGLRWELNPAPSGRGATILASWTNVNDPTELALAPLGTPLWVTTYGNVAPRIGVAYGFTSNGDLVLRAGGGIFYDLGMGAVGDLSTTFPNIVYAYTTGVPLPAGDLSPYLPVRSFQPPYPDAAEGFVPNLKLPRSYQWNVSLEKAFLGNQAVSASYVGQAGRSLLRQEALYQPNSDFIGEFLLTQNSASSDYDALQLQYRRPLLAHLQALLNYTWSHSLDIASNDVVAGLPGTVISAADDRGSSDFDVRHSFSGAITYSVPAAVKSGVSGLLTKNWSIDSVVVLRSGFPFNAIVYSTSPDPEGYAVARPDRIPGQPSWVSDPPAPGGKIVNANAFSIPSTIRQGTEGRNDIAGFGLSQVDLSVGRTFPVSDRMKVQFRADAFNILNHPNFMNPIADLDPTCGVVCLGSSQMVNQGLGGLIPLFQEGGPRSLQLSLKFEF